MKPPILLTNYEDGNNHEVDEITLPGGNYEFNFKTLPTSTFKDGGDGGSMAQVEINFKRTSASRNQVFGGYYVQTGTFATLSLLSYFIEQSIVPGRMGMLITLYLIKVNTYNSVEAPPGRGFSSIDIWSLGMQIPILVAILEYGILLSMKKFWTKGGNQLEDGGGNYETIMKHMDLFTFIASAFYLVVFNVCYWFIGMFY